MSRVYRPATENIVRITEPALKGFLLVDQARAVKQLSKISDQDGTQNTSITTHSNTGRNGFVCCLVKGAFYAIFSMTTHGFLIFL